MFEGKERYLDYLLTSTELFSAYGAMIRAMKLAPAEKQFVEWVFDFKGKYTRMPTMSELGLIKQVTLSTGIEDKVMFSETLDLVKNYKMQEWILNQAERLDLGRTRPEELFAGAKRLVDDFSGREYRMSEFKAVFRGVIDALATFDYEEKISTGLVGLDKALFGGPSKGEFLCLIAPPGRGKTMSLINWSYGALLCGKNVLFITLELSEEKILGRFVRRVSKLSRKDIRLSTKKAHDSVNRFCGLSGNLIARYVRPHSLTVDALGVMVDKAAGEIGAIDVVVIDYFDRMSLPHRDARLGYGLLVDYLRDMAADKGVAIETATQANRASLSALLVTEEHVGESLKKFESADIVLSINRSQQDMSRNAGRYVILKNREWGNVGVQVPIMIDWDKSYIGDYGQ